MIELDRAKALLVEARESRRSELVSAHATIGRLLLQRSPAVAGRVFGDQGKGPACRRPPDPGHGSGED